VLRTIERLYLCGVLFFREALRTTGVLFRVFDWSLERCSELLSVSIYVEFCLGCREFDWSLKCLFTGMVWSLGVAGCCRLLQGVAGCCSVSQCCSAMLCVVVRCSVMQSAEICCSVLQCVAVCCSVLPCDAVCDSVLHYIAVRCSVLQ